MNFSKSQIIDNETLNFWEKCKNIHKSVLKTAKNTCFLLKTDKLTPLSARFIFKVYDFNNFNNRLTILFII